MPEIIGKVMSVETKAGTSARGDWTRWGYKIAGPDGEHTYSTFDSKLSEQMKPPCVYRIQYNEKDNPEGAPFRNLASAVQVDPSEFGAQPASNGAPPAQREYQPGPAERVHNRIEAAAAPKPGRTYDEGRDIERASIQAQTALKTAVEYAGTRKGNTETVDILTMAGLFLGWLTYGGPEVLRMYAGLPESPPEQRNDPLDAVGPSASHAAFDGDGNATAPTEGVTGEVDPGAPANMGQLLTWVKKNRPADVSGTDLVVVREVLGFTPEADPVSLKAARDTLREKWGE
jgi:hypothetical protein